MLHIVDLDRGAIVAANVRPRDAGDSENLSTRVIEPTEQLEDLHAQPSQEGRSRVKTVTTDKGFHDAAELAILVRTVIGAAHAPRRNLDRLAPEARAAVVQVARDVVSQSGEALLKQKGEKIERGFAHVIVNGGQRRTALRGLDNIKKRYPCGIIGFNLGLIPRKLTGMGIPRQAAAAKAARRGEGDASFR